MTIDMLANDRETIASQAAGRTLVLMEKFNEEADWKGGTPEIAIHPFDPANDTWTVGLTVTLAKPAKPGLWQEKYKEREAIVKDVALVVSGPVGQDVAGTLSSAGREDTLSLARIMAEQEVCRSLSFMNGASNDEVDLIARDAIKYARQVITAHASEFANLTEVFKACDKLTGVEEISAAAQKGQKPPKP